MPSPRKRECGEKKEKRGGGTIPQKGIRSLRLGEGGNPLKMKGKKKSSPYRREGVDVKEEEEMQFGWTKASR